MTVVVAKATVDHGLATALVVAIPDMADIRLLCQLMANVELNMEIKHARYPHSETAAATLGIVGSPMTIMLRTAIQNMVFALADQPLRLAESSGARLLMLKQHSRNLQARFFLQTQFDLQSHSQVLVLRKPASPVTVENSSVMFSDVLQEVVVLLLAVVAVVSLAAADFPL